MRKLSLSLLLVVLATIFTFGNNKRNSEYVVITTNEIKGNPEWMKVVNVLSKKHQAGILFYDKKPSELLEELKDISPRYVAIVEKPENIGRDYIIEMNQLSRKIDKDDYADFLWGIITGYDAAAAMRMVDNSTEPLIMKSAVATIQELSEGKWFDEIGYIKDHNPIGLYGEKQKGEQKVTEKAVEQKINNSNTPNLLEKFIELYYKYNPDLFVTASHATENNLEMPGSVGNLRCKDGKIRTDYPGDKIFLKDKDKRMVYLPIGNCLIGNVNNTKNSMAIAWMNGQNAATYVGYVVTTWHGRNGWGGLKYLLTTPGKYNVAEAFYMNQQDMIAQLEAWHKIFVIKNYNHNKSIGENANYISQSIGKDVTKDQIGFFHDRDVLAYYGDPKWDARLKELPEENDYSVKTQKKGGKYIISIKTKPNFNLKRMAGDDFKKEHVLDLPFNYFFPERIKNPRLQADETRNIIVDENFILLYNPDFKPNKTYKIILDIDK